MRTTISKIAGYAAAFLAGITLAGTVAAVTMTHTRAPHPCTFDGGGTIASGDAARTTDGHVWACADGQLYRIDRPGVMMPAIFPLVGKLAGHVAHRAARIAWGLTPRWLRVPLEFCAGIAVLPATFLLTARLSRIIRAVMPRWMLAAFVVCLAIPGPFDEAAMIIAGLILAVFRYRRTASAWRGGKSHRHAAD